MTPISIHKQKPTKPTHKQDTNNTTTTDIDIDDIWGAGSDDEKPKSKVDQSKRPTSKTTVEEPAVEKTAQPKSADTVDDIWGAGSDDEKPKAKSVPTKRTATKTVKDTIEAAVEAPTVEKTATPKPADTIDDIWGAGSDDEKPKTKRAEPENLPAVDEPKVVKKTVKKTVPKSSAESGTALEPNSKKAAPLNKKKKLSEVAAVGEPIEELTVQPIVEEPTDDIWADSNGADEPQPARRVRDVPSIVVKSPTVPNLVEQTATVEEVLTEEEDEDDAVEPPATPTVIVEEPTVKPLKSALKKPVQNAVVDAEPTVAADVDDIWGGKDDDLPASYERAAAQPSTLVEPKPTAAVEAKPTAVAPKTKSPEVYTYAHKNTYNFIKQ